MLYDTLKVDRLEKDLEAGLNAPFGARCFMTYKKKMVDTLGKETGLNAPFGARCFMTCSRCVILAGRFYRS